MLQRLLPATTALPVWRLCGIRALEARLQAACSEPLMDLAGLATARLAMAVAPHARQIWVAAGPGNNGGDGLEAALHLHRWGRSVQVSLLAEPERLPPDARRALERAKAHGVTVQAGLSCSPLALDAHDLCIDALLGIGGARAPSGDLLEAIRRLNAQSASVLSIDIPSGVDADSGQLLGASGTAVLARHTLTMLGAKPGLFMGHGRDHCGTLWLAPLGLPDTATPWCTPDAELTPPPQRTVHLHASHKGNRGDVAIVGGESSSPSSGMTGAALLAAQSALHGGAGRVILSLLGTDHPHGVADHVPDLMRRHADELQLSDLTVVAGCGGGMAIAAPLGRLLQHSARLVMDADALNRLAEDPWLQDLLRQRAGRGQATVLTPHPLEAARLLDTRTAEVQADRLKAAETLVQRFGVVVVLKGSGTVIAAPGHRSRINATGNGRLATGGTGDVLAGFIGARLAATGSAWQAACEAVWSHGQIADGWPSGLALTASRLAQRLD